MKRSGPAAATADLALALPRSGQYYTNVHASRNSMGTIIAWNTAPPIK